MTRRSWVVTALAIPAAVALWVLLLPGVKQRLAAGVTVELNRKFAGDALYSSPTAAINYFAGCEILPLCEAIQRSDHDRVVAILDSGIDLNETTKSGLTALTWALAWGQDDFVIELLRRGASPDVVLIEPIEVGRVYFDDGDTFLLSAIKQRRFEPFFAALGFTKDPNRKDRHGIGVLPYYVGMATRGNRGGPSGHTIARIEQIIHAGVDINARSDRGNTVLHHALRSYPEFALVLLERGADPAIENNKGVSALQVLAESLDKAPEATKVRYQPVIDWLTERGLF